MFRGLGSWEELTSAGGAELVIALGVSCESPTHRHEGMPAELAEVVESIEGENGVAPGALCWGSWGGHRVVLFGVAGNDMALIRPSWVLWGLKELRKELGDYSGDLYVCLPSIQGCPSIISAELTQRALKTSRATVCLIPPTTTSPSVPPEVGYPWLGFIRKDEPPAEPNLGHSPPSVQALIEESLISEAEEEYSRRVGVYHPSGIGNPCERCISYERLGVRPEKEASPGSGYMSARKFVGIMARGHAVHNDLQARLERIAKKHEADTALTLTQRRLVRRGSAAGWKISEVTNEALARSGVLRLHGSCDSLIVFRKGSSKEKWLLELKSTDRPDNKRKPDTDHVLQIHCYMIALDVPRAVILYVSPSDMAMKEFHVYYSASIGDQILSKIARIESLLSSGSLPARNETPSRCTSCKFSVVCAPSVLSSESSE